MVNKSPFAYGAAVQWNGDLFESQLPPRRTSRVVRTHPKSPEEVLRYNQDGWPDKDILITEYGLALVNRGMTMDIRSTAPEAAEELPSRVITPVRDLGVYLDAKLDWRGRLDPAYVSVSLTSVEDRQSIGKEELRIRNEKMPKIVRDYQKIILSDKTEIDFTRKAKRRGLVKYLHALHRAGKLGEFSYQSVVEDYNRTAPSKIKSDRMDDDLFKGQQEDFDRLFETIDKTNQVFRMKLA